MQGRPAEVAFTGVNLLRAEPRVRAKDMSVWGRPGQPTLAQ